MKNDDLVMVCCPRLDGAGKLLVVDVVDTDEVDRGGSTVRLVVKKHIKMSSARRSGRGELETFFGRETNATLVRSVIDGTSDKSIGNTRQPAAREMTTQ